MSVQPYPGIPERAVALIVPVVALVATTALRLLFCIAKHTLPTLALLFAIHYSTFVSLPAAITAGLDHVGCFFQCVSRVVVECHQVCGRGGQGALPTGGAPGATAN